MTAPGAARLGGEHLYAALREHDIELLVGLPGTQTLPLDTVIADRGGIRYVMARHETAIPHIAWGYYEASGRPAATLTVPGPGETNAMHGLKNALEDCVPIIHMTGDVHPDDMGKKPIHEITPSTYDSVVKANVTVSSTTDLPAAIERGIEAALSPPRGPVRLGIPYRLLTAEFAAPTASVEPERIDRDNSHRFDRAAEILANAKRPIVYAGGGCRRTSDGPAAVRAIADTFEAAVVTSYKGKGVFPEDDPRFIGVTGGSLPPGATKALEQADAVLALGTDFDGVTTDGREVPMGEHLIHVNLDPDAIGATYEPAVSIVADVAEAVAALDERLEGHDPPADRWDPARIGVAIRREYHEHLTEAGLLNEGPPLHTPAVLETVRSATPDDAIVTVDVGGFRLWAMQAFEAYAPTDFIAAGSWAGMGVGLPAAIGAKLARPEATVVCLSGDGGLLMCIHELATAAAEDCDIVLIVSNNEDYGIISKKSEIRTPAGGHPFAWSSPDYVTIAEGFGWHGETVADAEALDTAVDNAIARDGPTLIDVDVPTEEPAAGDGSAFESAIELDEFS
jgi:acetolactate synthase-1/2/3 large subunit